MAASKKRRLVEKAEGDCSDSESGGEEGSDQELSQEQVDVVFDGHAPTESDFQGIKQLLQQLFLKAHIDLSQLADILIQQDKITCVVKNVVDSDMEDDEEEEEEDSENFAFAVTSIVNITEKKDKDCIRQLKDYLLEKCKAVCSSDELCGFKSVLENEDHHVGFIINERLMNIPAMVSVPLFQSLSEDMKKADLEQKKRKFNFTNYLLISKVLNEKSQPDDERNLQYVNEEEMLFVEDASFKFDFSVADEQDCGLGGKWTDEDMEWHPKRRVVIVPGNKWETIMTKLKNEFSTT